MTSGGVKKQGLIVLCLIASVASLQSVNSMVSITFEYESTDEYPTAMYFIHAYNLGFTASDSSSGGARVYQFALDGSNERATGASTAGYLPGKKMAATYTHITDINVLGFNVVIAEESCIRFHTAANGEFEAERIGNCTNGGFQTDPVLLQDNKAIHVTSDGTMLYILCGNNGTDQGGLMKIDLADNTGTILAMHDDLISNENSTLTGMVIDSSDSTLYFHVDNGGLMAYDISQVPTGGNMTLKYHISAEGADNGANYTHSNLISASASMVLSNSDTYLVIQNYNNEDESDNSLISIDLSEIESSENGPIPSRSYSYLCTGGTQFVAGSSSSCKVKADLMKPLLQFSTEGNLIMKVKHSLGEEFQEYILEEWIYSTTTTTSTPTTTSTTSTSTTTSTTSTSTTTSTTTPSTTSSTSSSTTTTATTTSTATPTTVSAATSPTTTTCTTTSISATSSTTSSVSTSSAGASISTVSAAVSSSSAHIDHTTSSTSLSASTDSTSAAISSSATTTYTRSTHASISSTTTPSDSSMTTSKTTGISTSLKTILDTSTLTTQTTTPPPSTVSTTMTSLGTTGAVKSTHRHIMTRCHACSSPEACGNMPTAATTLCTGACYSWSELQENGNIKSMRKGCSTDMVSEELTAVLCDEGTKQGICHDFTDSNQKVEGCLKCCTSEDCNMWLTHEEHRPSGSGSQSILNSTPYIILYLCSLIYVFQHFPFL